MDSYREQPSIADLQNQLRSYKAAIKSVRAVVGMEDSKQAFIDRMQQAIKDIEDKLNRIPGSNQVGPATYRPPMIRGAWAGGRKSRKVYKRRMLRRGGALMDIVPQQIVNSGRGVSSFVMDKFNGYQGYPEQASYLPYDQPIDSLNVAEVIRLY